MRVATPGDGRPTTTEQTPLLRIRLRSARNRRGKRRRKHPFFVTVNADITALVRPVFIGVTVFTIHWPFLFGSLILVRGFCIGEDSVILGAIASRRVTPENGSLPVFLHHACFRVVFVRRNLHQGFSL